MAEFVGIYESTILFEVQVMKGKLAARGIESFITNEFVNNVATMPLDQGYQLRVDKAVAEEALAVIHDVEELDENDFLDEEQ